MQNDVSATYCSELFEAIRNDPKNDEITGAGCRALAVEMNDDGWTAEKYIANAKANAWMFGKASVDYYSTK